MLLKRNENNKHKVLYDYVKMFMFWLKMVLVALLSGSSLRVCFCEDAKLAASICSGQGRLAQIINTKHVSAMQRTRSNLIILCIFLVWVRCNPCLYVYLTVHWVSYSSRKRDIYHELKDPKYRSYRHQQILGMSF